MPIELPRHSGSSEDGARWRALGSIVKRIAVFAILAVIATGSIYYLNLSLDAALPDPLHRSVEAAVSAASSRASTTQHAPVPANFSAQFPEPTGPVEAQPEAF